MKRIRAYKTELKLNNKQRSLCEQHAGVARFAYNWGLDRKIKAYEATGESPSAISLHRELNALKPTDFPWMYDVSKCAPQEALRDLDVAYKNFFRRVKQGTKAKGFPKFKSKHRSKKKFRLTGSIRVFEDQIQLPRLGRLRLKEKGYLPVEGTPDVRILSATVSERAGRWYVSVQVEKIVPGPATPKGKPVGVDLGVKSLATLSDGTQYANPRALKKHSKRSKDFSAQFRGAKKAAPTGTKPWSNSHRRTPEWLTFEATHFIRSPVNWRKPNHSSRSKI